MNPTFIVFLIVIIVAVFGSGFTSAGLCWYNQLNKPQGTPAPAVFGIVWPILYFLIAVSTSRALNFATCPSLLASVFGIQIFLNLLWSLVFFTNQDARGGLVVLLLLLIFAILQLVLMFQIDALAGWLFLPYVLWLLYATYLNWGIIQANPDLTN